MTDKLVLGPIIGLESDNHYTILFVVKNIQSAVVLLGEQSIQAQCIGEIVSGGVWRTDIHVPQKAQGFFVEYKVVCDNKQYQSQLAISEWAFYVPGVNEKPKFAYASCNGFSDYRLMNTAENPYRLWDLMKSEHDSAPFAALLMGGDQVYADSIWSAIEPLQKWNELGIDEKIKRQATVDMKKKIDRFYSELYVSRWNQPQVAQILATIPSVMMWDDHDIFDGWGSYPEKLTNCPVYQAIYGAAKKYFELLQVRGAQNRSLIGNLADLKHYSMSLKFGSYTILALAKFYDVFKEETYSNNMKIAFNWFLGNNHLHQIIYNPCTGGCYDGLEDTHVNLNQGAESTVSYLMARLCIEEHLKSAYIAKLKNNYIHTNNHQQVSPSMGVALV
jgi:hypothetical protein